MNTHTLSLGVAALCLLASAAATQMELRVGELYERDRFLSAHPAVGTMAPDLVLTDLEGRMQALSSLRGRFVVVVKGGFT